MLVGRRSFPFEMVPFQVTFVHFRGGDFQGSHSSWCFYTDKCPFVKLKEFSPQFSLETNGWTKVKKTNPSNYCDSIDMCLICVEQHPPSQYTLHPDNPNFITSFSAVHPHDEPNLTFA